MEAAKSRVEQLNKDLRYAKVELAKTRDAARKAEQAATEAKQSVNRNRRRSKRDLRRHPL